MILGKLLHSPVAYTYLTSFLCLHNPPTPTHWTLVVNMESEGLRQRSTGQHEERKQETGHQMPKDEHPAGPVKHGKWVEALRALLLGLYFLLGAVAIHASQIIGSPLYFFNKDHYYSWMAMTKQNFGVLSTTLNQFWAPVTFRISGDKSVKGQIRINENGMLECDFPERHVLIANHQIYTDWMYLWWIAYANRMHGHIYIILKESLKWIPILGTGMMFFSFIFLSRKWETDKARFTHRLRKLNRKHHNPMSWIQCGFSSFPREQTWQRMAVQKVSRGLIGVVFPIFNMRSCLERQGCYSAWKN
jgi:lysocardiolipin and lysophospholipid acyltransferase